MASWKSVREEKRTLRSGVDEELANALMSGATIDFTGTFEERSKTIGQLRTHAANHGKKLHTFTAKHSNTTTLWYAIN